MSKTKEEILMILNDISVQDPQGKTYEHRILHESDFDNIADSICKVAKRKSTVPPSYLIREARDYAKDSSLCPTLDGQEEIDKAHREDVEKAYRNGFTACSSIKDKEIAELQCALKDLLKKIDGLPPLSAIAGVLENEYKQAKQLLNKEL